MPAKHDSSSPTKVATARPLKTAAMTATKAAQAAARTLNLDDVGRLAIALAVAAAQEVEENSDFARRVQDAYEKAPPSQQRRTDGDGNNMPKALTTTLTPIRRVEGGEINPVAPLDPYLLLEVYGPQQLRQALDLYPVAKVREAAAAVAERVGHKQPAAKASKAQLITFIVAQLLNASTPT